MMGLRLIKYNYASDSMIYVFESSGTGYTYAFMSQFKIAFDSTASYMYLITQYDDLTSLC